MVATCLDEVTGDLPPSGSEPDLITAFRMDKTLMTVREWVRTGSPPSWSDCSGISPELRSWYLQFGNLSIDSDDRLWRHRAPPATALQLVVPTGEQRGFIQGYQGYHDSICAGHLGVSRTVSRLLDRVSWPGLHEDVGLIWPAVRYVWPRNILVGRQWDMFSSGANGTCSRRAPMGHVSVGY